MEIKFDNHTVIYAISSLYMAIEAARQWHKNGDHPFDYKGVTEGFENGELRTFSGEHAKANDWEGWVVRRYRTPKLDGQQVCAHCGHTMHYHGWIDQKDSQVVCPGDWVLMMGEQNYPLKPTAFAALKQMVENSKTIRLHDQPEPEPDDSVTPNA